MFRFWRFWCQGGGKKGPETIYIIFRSFPTTVDVFHQTQKVEKFMIFRFSVRFFELEWFEAYQVKKGWYNLISDFPSPLKIASFDSKTRFFKLRNHKNGSRIFHQFFSFLGLLWPLRKDSTLMRRSCRSCSCVLAHTKLWKRLYLSIFINPAVLMTIHICSLYQLLLHFLITLKMDFYLK